MTDETAATGSQRRSARSDVATRRRHCCQLKCDLSSSRQQPQPHVLLLLLVVSMLCVGAALARSIEKLAANEHHQSNQRLQRNQRAPKHLEYAIHASSGANSSQQAKGASFGPPDCATATCQEPSEPERKAKDEEEEDEPAGAGPDDNDAEDCAGLSAGESRQGARLSDNARLVNLQACLQKRVQARLAGSRRASLEMFERLSLSGACTASLMSLMGALGDIKAFAFKFLDASAKIPSGVMYGLLSDFGDFDQCLSIRSDARVEPAHEAEEHAYSGKYCLLTIKLNYRVQLAPNESAPEGIYADGVLWDELMRNYWTSGSTKGFQLAVCVPSRCTTDDLGQMYALLAENYNFRGEVASCQDSNDVRRQRTPDALQALILCALASLLLANLLATLLDRYEHLLPEPLRRHLAFQLLVCFSLSRNWRLFLGQRHRSPEARRAPPLGHQASSLQSNNTELSLVAPPSQQDQQELVTPQSSLASDPSRVDMRADEDEEEKELEQQKGKKEETAGEGKGEAPTLEVEELSGWIKCPDSQPQQQQQPEGATCEHQVAGQRRRLSADCLAHLSGLKLLVIVWITLGHSFLYPSANNYQYYRSIINLNITRDSVWFATTNFTLGIDMLLYMSGLLFVHGLAPGWQQQQQQRASVWRATGFGAAGDIWRLLARKVLRLWPAYVALIALAFVLPLLADGPMWPEMVERRLGAACRHNWWANVLMVNNFMSESAVCLPSSWFVSVLMQCLLVGALVMLVARRRSEALALALIGLLLLACGAICFAFAYKLEVRAPAIRMDETFVMEIDDTIYRLYTSTFSNLGPFLVGMLGGFVLLRRQRAAASRTQQQQRPAKSADRIERLSALVMEVNVALAMGLVAILVLSSVFHRHYTRLWAAVYWSCHRLGWALVTGYLVHQCAVARWRLLRDLLTLGTLEPLTKLAPVAYLAYPMFTHIHSGLVRDGLHVSIYNMLNIYITRLVLTFATALLLHLLVQLPVNSIHRLLLLESWSCSEVKQQQQQQQQVGSRESEAKRVPLLARVQPVTLNRKGSE